MKLSFFTNFINHHQVPVADELYRHLGDNYRFVATMQPPGWIIKSGYPEYEDKPYLIRAYENADTLSLARRWADESDIVIIGSAPESFVRERLRKNKITFHYQERWFKKITYRMVSPRLWYHLYVDHIRYRNKRSYLLCAGAYAATDADRVFAYPDKCLKWGYFPKVESFDIDSLLERKRDQPLKLLWCARFLDWKHPELAVSLAGRLRDLNYDFHLDMIGSGEKQDAVRRQIESLDLSGHVSLLGNMPNERVLEMMRSHHVFLFTSDRYEGWGAVLNEAMSNGCAAVASHRIGSVPFLIRQNETGLMFESEDVESLTRQVCKLLDSWELRENIAKNAYRNIRTVWSPQSAAQGIVHVSEALLAGESFGTAEGPCSPAVPCTAKEVSSRIG